MPRVPSLLNVRLGLCVLAIAGTWAATATADEAPRTPTPTSFSVTFTGDGIDGNGAYLGFKIPEKSAAAPR